MRVGMSWSLRTLWVQCVMTRMGRHWKKKTMKNNKKGQGGCGPECWRTGESQNKKRKKEKTSVGAPGAAVAAILNNIIWPNEWQSALSLNHDFPNVRTTTVCKRKYRRFTSELRSDLGVDCVDCSCWLPYDILNWFVRSSWTKTNFNHISAS